jgi:8-oxo-dGTP pyrophosphatase MutT (NUDIX family)
LSASSLGSEREPIDAAVLVPVYRDAAGELRVVLLRRTQGGPHGGQLAFPGGKVDPIDPSLRDAALREAQEEIGLDPASVEIVTELDPFETRATGFRIHPFLARVTRPERWTPAEREVAEVLEPRVADLVDPANRGHVMERFEGWPTPIRIDFIYIGKHRLWGATYKILTSLLARLQAGEWTF